jgi:cytochrome c peroxidase
MDMARYVSCATCYMLQSGFSREFEDLSGGGRLFHVLHATKTGYMGSVRAEILNGRQVK